MRERLPEGVDIAAAMRRLQAEYAPRGVNLVRVAGKWTFRTANDLSWLLAREIGRAEEAVARRDRDAGDHRLSPAGDARRDRGHPRRHDVQGHARRAAGNRLDPPARPPQGAGPAGHLRHHRGFLAHFGLEAIGDLPGLDELKGAGLLDGRLPAGFSVPLPSDDPALREDEDPLEPGDLDLGLAPRPEPEE